MPVADQPPHPPAHSPAHPSPSRPASVLAVSTDEVLLADLHRLAAAAGVPLEVAGSAAEARPSWPTAPVLLVGPDALADLAASRPPRRDGVHVVAPGEVPDHVFRSAVEIGAESVLELPAAASWLVETLVDCADGATGLASVVGVVGGSGGAGATTFATALAVAAASDLPAASDVRPVVLVDADPLGPGVEQVAGLDDVPGARWAELQESAGRLGSRSLREALPRREGLAVLGWGPGVRAGLDPVVAREVVSAAQRGGALVVVDLPRHLDPATTELLHRCDHLVVVTGLTSTAVASTLQVAARFRSLAPRVHLVARGPLTGLDPEEVATVLGLPVLAAMPDQRRLAESVELGLGPLRSRRGPLARAARSVLAWVGAPAHGRTFA